MIITSNTKNVLVSALGALLTASIFIGSAVGPATFI